MPIDLDTLNELKEIMEDDFDELLSVFISDGQSQIDNLRLAINSSNTADTRRSAHTLKGSSANLGLHSLSESCQLLEYKAAEDSLEGATELLQQIISNYEAVKKTLEENF